MSLFKKRGETQKIKIEISDEPDTMAKPQPAPTAKSTPPPPPPVIKRPTLQHEAAPPPPRKPGTAPKFGGGTKSVLKVRLFPNTGHHFFFMSQENLGGGNDHPNLSDWQELTDENGDPARWGLYRWGRNGTEEGVWFCLESNVGSHRRGSVYVSRFESSKKGQPPSRIPTPYIAENLPELPQPDQHQALYLCPAGGKGASAWAKVEVSWRQAMAQRAINVDLIVDFGNTRTVVLMNEEPTVNSGAPAQESLSSIVRPVPFLSRDETGTEQIDGDRHILPSWFINHQPQFASREPPGLKEADAVRDEVTDVEGNVDYESRRIPQTFVEMAPVVLGEAAQKVLGDISFSEGGRYFLGSPKRYVWDNEQLGDGGASLFWCMVNNPWTGGQPTSLLAANILRFMPGSGRDWDIASPPNELPPVQRPKPNPPEPLYPNADAMTWVALGIIENAYRQMNSLHSVQNNNPNVLRRLNSIQVTYPSGWTKAEIDAYRAKWEKAVNIFSLNHLPDNQVPKLDFPVDEAVASQLPIVFADILNMGGNGDNWLELVGRPIPATESGNKASHRARVMTIDIGGGTTDYAIIEYEDQQEGAGVILHTKLLFKDCNTTAGDELVLNLIEKLLLPNLGANLRDEDRRESFRNVFATTQANPLDAEEWKRITRLVLIPKVHQWLTDLCEGSEPAPGHTGLHNSAVDKLNEYVTRERLPGNLFKNDINVTADDINTIVEQTFQHIFQRFAMYVCAFDVDQVVLCGKPSEIPRIGEMLEDALPLPTQRIIRAKGFDAGTWYPFHKAGKIRDAKTVTAVGVALQTAVKYGKINGWSIKTSTSEHMQTNNEWVVIGNDDEETVALAKDETEKTIPVQPNSYLGRRLQPGSSADQVYVVQWRGNAEERPMQITITLRRRAIQGETEDLELLHAQDPEGTDLGQNVQLKLCTLDGQSHWIDNPKFDVQWEEDEPFYF